jgi:hypothetical protein
VVTNIGGGRSADEVPKKYHLLMNNVCIYLEILVSPADNRASDPLRPQLNQTIDSNQPN